MRSSSKSTPLAPLKASLIARDVRNGFALLDAYFTRSRRLPVDCSTSFEMLFVLAQWSDLGYRDRAFFERQLALFAKVKRSQLRAEDYLHLRFAETYRLFARDEHAATAAMLASLLHANAELLPLHVKFVALFWKGRANRLEGDFEAALSAIRSAREVALVMEAEKLVAVTAVHQSWLLFHRGERGLALDLLDQAERVLLPTGHALSLGNIAAARGRFFRSSGEYDRALTYFEQAIQLYRTQFASHPNLARALVNAAYVKRLQALQLQPGRGSPASASINNLILQIVHEAMEFLRDARTIYSSHEHQAGTGSVLINLGHLQLESGEIEAASEEGLAAYSLGQVKNDPVLMARARILQAYVEMACAEEQIDFPSNSKSPGQRAIDFAEEAIALSQATQNSRLLAAAYITRGHTAADVENADWDLVLRCAARAEELLASGDRDHLSQELSGLRKKIAQSQALEITWRRWVNGDLDGKTFQQVEEEFAAIVIPQVWMKLGQNVSRVAKHLSVSPKKVRRALGNAPAVRSPNRDS